MSHMPGFNVIDTFGFSNAILAGSRQDVWSGGVNYTFTTTAQAYYLSSTALGDTQNYEVRGLDENWEEQTVEVVAQGQTKTRVGTTEIWMRIYRIKNFGTTDNAGEIWVYEDDTVVAGVPQTDSKKRAHIAIGENQSLMCIWTMPAGKYGYMRQWDVAIVGLATPQERECTFDLRIRPFGTVFQVKKKVAMGSQGTSALLVPFSVWSPELAGIDEKSDVKVAVTVNGNNSACTAGFQVEFANKANT
jgi:hypothetical protein